MIDAGISTFTMNRILRQWLDSLRAHFNIGLLLLVLLLGGSWAFIEITDEVFEGSTQRFDDWAIKALRRADDPATPIGPRILSEVGRDLTALGGVAVLMLMTAAVVVYLLMLRKHHAMWLVIGATAGGLMLSTILKQSFDRPRPELVPHLSQMYTSSFPSGHSMMSAIVYLTLGSLLAQITPRQRLKSYFIGVALLLTFLVGISRVYMGVHYPTDVLAGWTAGLVWALICWLVARYLQARGQIECDD
jgi:undecaprenyl-diphosphatase